MMKYDAKRNGYILYAEMKENWMENNKFSFSHLVAGYTKINCDYLFRFFSFFVLYVYVYSFLLLFYLPVLNLHVFESIQTGNDGFTSARHDNVLCMCACECNT